MAPQSDLGQPARPLCSQSPLLSPFGSTQLERDPRLEKALKLGSGLTCLTAPDVPFQGREKAVSKVSVEALEWGTALRAGSTSQWGELTSGSDSYPMLHSPLASQLMMTWSWAQ